ncbi:hypothetical protein HAX54_042105 [Datura stramonium]|uniref:Uncharacterized protein n=1 Tax=Datura stramonium TaxID=4076 RepID=A0ABS8SN05_DATST|nr:hypothetical protein [Datura stramonium]
MWDCYDEWSAYGVGAPIVLKDDVSVIRYYVPHLSAIHIYTIKSPATLSLSGDHNTDENDSKNLSDESDSKPMESPKGRLGYLYFEYSDVAAISWRIPLLEKVSKLSQNHPGIEKLKSTDLSPASWMAITWYILSFFPLNNNVK